MKKVSTLTVVPAVALAIVGVALAAGPSLTGRVTIDGSSTVEPITTAVAEEFAEVQPDVNVTVGISGTGGGFKRFTVGETDISNASRPIKKEEAEAAAKNAVEYIEIPVAFDGLTIVINPSNTWVDHLTMDEIRKIFTAEGSAKNWSDVRAGWPNQPIKIFSPGTDSGTFDYFKEEVAGKKGSIRSDMQVSEDDNVLVTGVAGDPNAIGFFGCAYYFENRDKIKSVPVDSGKGAIKPTHDTILDGSYAPFSRPLFIYVNKKSAARPEMKAFVEFYLANAATIAEEVGYVQLPSAVYERAGKNFATMRTGTQFLDAKGEKVHGAIADIYK